MRHEFDMNLNDPKAENYTFSGEDFICAAFFAQTVGATPTVMRLILTDTQETPEAVPVKIRALVGGKWHWYVDEINHEIFKNGIVFERAEKELDKIYPDVKHDGTDPDRVIWATVAMLP